MLSHRLGSAALLLLSVMAASACSGSDGDGSGAESADTASAPSGPSCVTAAGSETVAGITIEIAPPEACDAAHSGVIRVTNAGEMSCSSNFNSIVAGNRLAFVSESGFGGEVGSWAPIAESEPDPVGVIEYPPGTREWPLLLPAGLAGDLNWSIAAIDCGADGYPFSIDFTASSPA